MIATLRDIHDRRTAELLAPDSANRLRESNRLLMMAEELASKVNAGRITTSPLLPTAAAAPPGTHFVDAKADT